MRTGIIGVGLMGQGIARNVLLRGGHSLTFLDHPGNQPVDELLALGATSVKTAAAVAAASDVIILCVTGSPQVEAVLTGSEGVLSELKPGTIVVDCSTALPESTQRMAKAVKQADGFFVDAPMTRTAKFAHEGKLHLLLGGDAAVIERVRPVLASFSEEAVHVGATGAGHRLKLLHNFVSVGFMSLLAEAAAQAADGGVDPQALVSVLRSGGGGGVALDRMAPFLLGEGSGNLPFAISNALKDFDYYIAMSEQAGALHLIADGVRAALSGAVEAGHGATYLPELSEILRHTKA
ncbi:NAD(P)-dependent oxidoreductase [Rhizobium oryzicola]|uniref:NAD(P)-dependent oxidoreductase n=1 Tax=Rhizobium oryzicola TaxID=1232668 RepID=A0ABT8SY30_9HYPH|nr:NAD(P)-dependent oxidoreductase [Rhizobium oryzicola]MDO1583380.1 NAD(P)-dependent oxidoreductase [Rhizobium oryzicola]